MGEEIMPLKMTSASGFPRVLFQGGYIRERTWVDPSFLNHESGASLECRIVNLE
jgi:hypothetical protein